MGFEQVDVATTFAKYEEEVLEMWERECVFDESMKRALEEKRPHYSFYDGPPFATGLPHYGHILAGTIKDIVTRYWHMNGYYVRRRFGWDTHGLPVEFEIDKEIEKEGKSTAPKDIISEIGIANYNQRCRNIVMRYSKEWESTVKRCGRWIDFENDYKTMDVTFMESVWWVFKQLFEAGQVYRGSRVMPFSTKCATPLSNMEANMDYRDVEDPAVYMTFPIKPSEKAAGLGIEGAIFVGWTTTPWTLPSNLALCVNGKMEYSLIQDIADPTKRFVIMTSRVCELYPAPKKKKGKAKAPEEPKYTTLATFAGEALRGVTYEPLFPFFQEWEQTGCFSVLVDDYVTDDSGTGVVHQAPFFGEDDYRVCLAHGLIKADGDMVCPVDDTGCFDDTVAEVLSFGDLKLSLAGRYVKACDPEIIAFLKAQGRVLSSSMYRHSYPHCWRSHTPLIQKALPCWFIRIDDQLKETMLDLNSVHDDGSRHMRWVPEFVQTRRFHQWLANARDWNVSRNRFWGTPMPIWMSEDGTQVHVIGSRAELKEHMAQLSDDSAVDDIHRDSVDGLTMPDPRGPDFPPMRRVTEVFDCWFESGSMPYAQLHYPFENKELFEQSFPADFIAEGLDQTRGWFYTLLVISAALRKQAPFKNLIINGLVLAEDGKKMSKSLRNFPDPLEVIHKHGADSLRLYLINSPVVRAESLKFNEKGVMQVASDVFRPLYNAYRFFVQNADQVDFVPELTDEGLPVSPSANTLDRWILANCKRLLAFMREEMDGYRLYTVVPELVRFIDQLTNWYVRMNRRRMKGAVSSQDQVDSLTTLHAVLVQLCIAMAPFTPFMPDKMYLNLVSVLPDAHPIKETSVHLLRFPTLSASEEELSLVDTVADMQNVVDLGRALRDNVGVGIKTPLRKMVITSHSATRMRHVAELAEYVKDELNVLNVETPEVKPEYVTLTANPNFGMLKDRKLGAGLKKVRDGCAKLSHDDIVKFLEAGEIDFDGVTVATAEVNIVYAVDKPKAESEGMFANHDPNFLVALNTVVDDELQRMAVSRKLVSTVQGLRKKAALVPTDAVDVVISGPDCDLEEVTQLLRQTVLTEEPAEKERLGEDELVQGEATYKVAIFRS
ncbi:Isoleucine-tRNA ligase [Carpediemonas membranifera]|uniref:isoleucine--tRNA ligase n=1 Tax=Carpediemonas membranifera TaxID=201153 RepID=A0A8J6E5C6_9EUKA|nr:Isoleucine-tRNA ligase [Carpediemonas membranifera]|eukprot:KAG9395572.1 Isoleucine-tRNA ligase [Carpediemonas membranifera]